MKIRGLLSQEGFVALLALLVLVAFSAPSVAAETTADKAAPQKIVVKLGAFTNDLHPSFMALKLAKMMRKAGADVTLFLNLEAVRIADKRHPLNLKWGHSGDLLSLYQEMVKSGVKVLVCPHCAKAAGVNTKALRRGTKIAGKGDIVKLFLDADKILDY